MMNNPIRVPKIQVGTPPPTLTNKEWEVIEVHYNRFGDLNARRGGVVDSPEFTCFGRKWRLQIYPGGHFSSGEGMVAVFLENRSDERIKLQYGFIVKDKEGIKVKKDYASMSNGTIFGSRGTPGASWGSAKFCRRLEVIEALVNGTLIIEVRMKSTADTVPTPFIPENPIAKSVLAMFNDEESADVVFEVEDEPVRSRSDDMHKSSKTTTTLYAHRLIIEKCAANVLGELCKSGEADTGATAVTTVSITDVKPEIFKHLLNYIYGGKVSDEDMKENAKEIIDAADKYGIVGLKLEAEASLVTNTTITFENAIDNLLHADSKNLALLKEAVMDFIYDNRKEAITKLSFENVPGSVMKDLLVAVNRGDGKGNSNAANDLPTSRVNDLRKLLHEKGLDVDGSREMLIARLEEEVVEPEEVVESDDEASDSTSSTSSNASTSSTSSNASTSSTSSNAS